MMDIKILIKKEKYICHKYTMIFRDMKKYFAVLFFTYFIFSLSTIAQPNVRAMVKNATCAGKNDGIIELEVSGNGPFKFKWSNGKQFQNIKNLSEGNYEVEVFDKTGKITTSKYEVKLINNLAIQILLENKNLEVKVLGGVSPYNFTLYDSNSNQKINPSQTSGIFQNLSSGNYTIAIKDSNGCVMLEGFEIN